MHSLKRTTEQNYYVPYKKPSLLRYYYRHCLCKYRECKFKLTRIRFEPLLFPFWSLNIVHSSIFPKGWNNCLTSSSVCCLLSMPTKSFRSSVRNKTKEFVQLHSFITFKIQQKKFISKKCTDLRDNYTKSIAVVVFQVKG